MSKLEDIKWQMKWAKENGIIPSTNVDSEDIEWLIKQAEKLEKIKQSYFNENFTITDYLRVSANLFDEKETHKRQSRQ